MNTKFGDDTFFKDLMLFPDYQELEPEIEEACIVVTSATDSDGRAIGYWPANVPPPIIMQMARKIKSMKGEKNGN